MDVRALAATDLGQIVEPDRDLLLHDALLFGRAAQDLTRIYAGTPFRLESHLERLAASADALGLPPIDLSGLRSLIRALLEKAGVREGILRLYWCGNISALDWYASSSAPDARGLVVVTDVPDHLERLRQRGLRLISLTTATDARVVGRSPWLLPGVKSVSRAVNAASLAHARRLGADDAVMVDRNQIVLQGPATSIWWRRGSRVFTPGLELGVLPGIIRALLIDVLPAIGYEIEEGVFRLKELTAAEEVFATSSAAEVVGVVRVDDRPIGSGAVGPAARELQEELRRLVDVECVQG